MTHPPLLVHPLTQLLWWKPPSWCNDTDSLTMMSPGFPVTLLLRPRCHASVGRGLMSWPGGGLKWSWHLLSSLRRPALVFCLADYCVHANKRRGEESGSRDRRGCDTEVINYRRCKLCGWFRTWCIFLTSPTSTELYTLQLLAYQPPNRTPFWLVPNLGKPDLLPHHAFPPLPTAWFWNFSC